MSASRKQANTRKTGERSKKAADPTRKMGDPKFIHPLIAPFPPRKRASHPANLRTAC